MRTIIPKKSKKASHKDKFSLLRKREDSNITCSVHLSYRTHSVPCDVLKVFKSSFETDVSNSCGSERIRTSEELSPLPLFESGTFSQLRHASKRIANKYNIAGKYFGIWRQISLTVIQLFIYLVLPLVILWLFPVIYTGTIKNMGFILY